MNVHPTNIRALYSFWWIAAFFSWLTLAHFERYAVMGSISSILAYLFIVVIIHGNNQRYAGLYRERWIEVKLVDKTSLLTFALGAGTGAVLVGCFYTAVMTQAAGFAPVMIAMFAFLFHAWFAIARLNISYETLAPRQ